MIIIIHPDMMHDIVSVSQKIPGSDDSPSLVVGEIGELDAGFRVYTSPYRQEDCQLLKPKRSTGIPWYQKFDRRKK